MAAHAYLKNEFMEDEKYHNLMMAQTTLSAVFDFVAFYPGNVSGLSGVIISILFIKVSFSYITTCILYNKNLFIMLKMYETTQIEL